MITEREFAELDHQRANNLEKDLNSFKKNLMRKFGSGLI
jgi:hypothetical protein